jgi:hypothetical protein
MAPRSLAHLRLLPHCMLLSVVLSACGGGGGGGSGSPATANTGSGVTASTLCDISGSGTQNVASTGAAINLQFTYSWACSGTSRVLSGNGIPNHDLTGGSFATLVSAQSVAATYTLNPSATSTVTAINTPTAVGYAINSVKFDPKTAGTCTNTATGSPLTGCNYAGGGGPWTMVAVIDPSVSPFRFTFGTDVSNGHTQPNGQYHYHGIPTNLVDKLNSNSTTSMTLVGWAADGFPVYSKLGRTTANDASSALKEMVSSYKVKSTPGTGRPSTSDFAMGHFDEDWVYTANSGDLDECNGRTGVTPEFPQGIYHYYITRTYPFIQRCVKGTL